MRQTTTAAVAEAEPAAQPVRLDLAGGHQLVVTRDDAVDSIALLAPNGAVTCSVHVTADGPVLRFEGGLTLEASGQLTLAGRRVAIRGAEAVSIESGADASIDAAGDLTTVARIQNIRARLGNVTVKANDDVKVTGERILLNC